MTRRALSGFIVINVIVSIVVALIIILVWDSTQGQEQIIVTRLYPVTATGGSSNVIGQAPDEAFQRTITALNSQSTEQARRLGTLEVVAATAGFQQPTETPFVVQGPAVDGGIPTLDPTVLGIVTLPAGVGSSNTTTNSQSSTDTPNDGCDRYTVVSGDTCGAIADRFGIGVNDLIQLNSIDSACLTLQQGQELRIPGPSCSLPPTQRPSPTITNTPFVIGTFSITNTPAPTSTASEVQIIQILNFGDITREQMDIQNTGADVIEMENWTLADAQGNTFTFPRLRMQPSQIIRIFTQIGQNTPGALYWNRTSAVWELGDTATLTDTSGTVQATYTITSTEINFGN